MGYELTREKKIKRVSLVSSLIFSLFFLSLVLVAMAEILRP